MDTQKLTGLAQTCTREQFIAMLPYGFLVLETALNERNAALSTSTIDAISDKRDSSTPSSPNIEIREIVKAPGNPYPDRISVGRSWNCDIVIRDSSVSKLHALFQVDAGELQLTDLHSKNGTHINGRLLSPHQPSLVQLNDTISFGSVRTRLVDAQTLYDLLR